MRRGRGGPETRRRRDRGEIEARSRRDRRRGRGQGRGGVEEMTALVRYQMPTVLLCVASSLTLVWRRRHSARRHSERGRVEIELRSRRDRGEIGVEVGEVGSGNGCAHTALSPPYPYIVVALGVGMAPLRSASFSGPPAVSVRLVYPCTARGTAGVSPDAHSHCSALTAHRPQAVVVHSSCTHLAPWKTAPRAVREAEPR
jgi:hypothetical protein